MKNLLRRLQLNTFLLKQSVPCTLAVHPPPKNVADVKYLYNQLGSMAGLLYFHNGPAREPATNLPAPLIHAVFVADDVETLFKRVTSLQAIPKHLDPVSHTKIGSDCLKLLQTMDVPVLNTDYNLDNTFVHSDMYLEKSKWDQSFPNGEIFSLPRTNMDFKEYWNINVLVHQSLGSMPLNMRKMYETQSESTRDSLRGFDGF